MSFFGKKADPKHEPRPAEPEPAPSGVSPRRAYTIDDAIQLMRTLPMNQNQDLVLLVVRNTLSSLNVELKHVIDDGSSKQEKLEKTVAQIKSGIADLEREILARQQELANVEADLAETTAVKERLELAAQREAAPAATSAAPAAIHTKPPLPSAKPAPPPPQKPPIVPGSIFQEVERETMEIDPLPESGPAPRS